MLCYFLLFFHCPGPNQASFHTQVNCMLASWEKEMFYLWRRSDLCMSSATDWSVGNTRHSSDIYYPTKLHPENKGERLAEKNLTEPVSITAAARAAAGAREPNWQHEIPNFQVWPHSPYPLVRPCTLPIHSFYVQDGPSWFLWLQLRCLMLFFLIFSPSEQNYISHLHSYSTWVSFTIILIIIILIHL